MAKTEGESDLAELAAKFAAHGGGRVSPELSADLALDVVLNEIVEQACLATGASGAAIVLERGGEWICRASAGGTAPDLGARLDTEAGLSGGCVKTRTVQRCDDAQTDPRADIEACRNLGVRSVIILPLLQNDRLAGVFELFSASPSAFAERDERTLEALSERVLKNLARASEPLSGAMRPVEHPLAGKFVAEYILAENMDATPGADRGSLDPVLPQPASEARPDRGINVVTWVLGVAVLAIAVLLAVRVGQRLGGGTAKAHAHAPSAIATPSNDAENQSTAGSRGATGMAASGTSGNQAAESKSSGPPTSRSASGSAASGAARVTDTTPPAGSLLVYENGKEVFRMGPSGGQRESAPVQASDMEKASAVEPDQVPAISADSAEDGILHRVEPEYPEEARQQGIQGPVVVDLDIGVDGKVGEAKIVSGPPLLAQPVVDAVKQWVFQPHSVNGQLVPMQRRITLNFRLPR
jgi:TonB family protein